MSKGKIKFTEDFAAKKKGEEWECDSLLASQLVNKDKVAVYVGESLEKQKQAEKEMAKHEEEEKKKEDDRLAKLKEEARKEVAKQKAEAEAKDQKSTTAKKQTNSKSTTAKK